MILIVSFPDLCHKFSYLTPCLEERGRSTPGAAVNSRLSLIHDSQDSPSWLTRQPILFCHIFYDVFSSYQPPEFSLGMIRSKTSCNRNCQLHSRLEWYLYLCMKLCFLVMPAKSDSMLTGSWFIVNLNSRCGFAISCLLTPTVTTRFCGTKASPLLPLAPLRHPDHHSTPLLGLHLTKSHLGDTACSAPHCTQLRITTIVIKTPEQSYVMECMACTKGWISTHSHL